MKHVQQLIKSIDSFYHPSNEGVWTGPLGDFMLVLCMKFAKRWEWERRTSSNNVITQAMVSEFVSICLPLALKAMYSKSSQMTTCANHALKQLACMCCIIFNL